MARQRRAWQRGMDRAGAMGSEHHRAKLPMYARIILHPLMGLLLLHLQSLMPEFVGGRPRPEARGVGGRCARRRLAQRRAGAGARTRHGEPSAGACHRLGPNHLPCPDPRRAQVRSLARPSTHRLSLMLLSRVKGLGHVPDGFGCGCAARPSRKRSTATTAGSASRPAARAPPRHATSARTSSTTSI